MAWWTKEIMGGDPAFNCADAYAELAGVLDTRHPANLSESTKRLFRQCIESNLAEWETACGLPITSIAAQVGILLAMVSGARITNEYKERSLVLVREDEWAKKDEDRKRYIDKLIENIEKYDGTEIDYRLIYPEIDYQSIYPSNVNFFSEPPDYEKKYNELSEHYDTATAKLELVRSELQRLYTDLSGHHPEEVGYLNIDDALEGVKECLKR